VSSVEVLLAALERSGAKLVFLSCPLVRWWIGHSTHDSRAHDGRGAARRRSCAAVEPSAGWRQARRSRIPQTAGFIARHTRPSCCSTRGRGACPISSTMTTR
jgi:hypothetical protein